MKSTKAMKEKEVIEMKRTWWMVVVLVLLGGLIAAGSLYANSTEPKIVFVGEDSNAYVAGIDGKNPRKITSSGMVSLARWLDADTVAVLVGEDLEIGPGRDIWLVQVTGEGKKATRLTKSGQIFSFACSPDSKWIVFARYAYGGEPGLCRINRDGSNLRVLRRSKLSDSPDFGYTDPVIVGQNTVFYVTASGCKILKLDSKGKQDRCIYASKPSPSEVIGKLVSSKNGQRIVFDLLSKNPHTEYGWDRLYVKEINARDFRAKTLIEIELSKGEGWELCSFMPSEQQVLLQGELGLYVLDLKPGAKPELLIRNAFDADVWYPGK